MNKRTFLKSVLDGASQAVILNLLSEFVLSYIAENLNLYFHLFFAVICSAFSTIVFYKFIYKESNGKSVLCFTINSIFTFSLSVILLVINKFTLRFTIFTFRETSGGDGIAILFVAGTFLLLSTFGRLAAYSIKQSNSIS